MSDPVSETAAPSPPAHKSSPVAEWSRRVLAEINKVFIGQDRLVRGVVLGAPGRWARPDRERAGAGQDALGPGPGAGARLRFNRIQFTPDLMPSDVTGSPIYDERIHDFRFRPGPVFTQLLLADEINRAPAKTHSALLEIMQETRVTIDGVNYPIEPPFLVLATQNPIESEGTYNLPEAQLDRFLFKLVVDYPSEARRWTSSACTRAAFRRTGTWREQLAAVTGPGRGASDAAELRGSAGG